MPCERRSAIESFFRRVKQTPKVTAFLCTSEKAARIQIAIAPIAFLVPRLAQQTQATIRSPLAFTRLVKANLMQTRGLSRLHESPGTTAKVVGRGVIQPNNPALDHV